MSEHVSSTIGLPPAVEPSLSLTHRLVATLTTRYLPDAADEATNVHWRFACGVPTEYCGNGVPDVVDDAGPSMHLPRPTLTGWYPEPLTSPRHCWKVLPDAHAAWVSSALFAVDEPGTSTHLP